MDVVLTRFGELDTKHQMKIFANDALRSRIFECGSDRELLDQLWGQALRALDPEAGVLDEKYHACFYKGRVYVWLGREHPLLVLLRASFVALEFAHPERRDPTFHSQHPLVGEGAALLPELRGSNSASNARAATLQFAEKVLSDFGEVMTTKGSVLAHKAYLLKEYIHKNEASADPNTLYNCVVSICKCLAEIN